MSDTCHDFQQLMTDALDGRLGEADRARFERVLAESEDRRRDWEAYREMRERLLAIGTETAPVELARRIGAAVRQDAGRTTSQPDSVGSWSHLRAMGWPRAAALVIALIAIAVVLKTELGSRPDDGEPEWRQVADLDNGKKDRPDRPESMWGEEDDAKVFKRGFISDDPEEAGAKRLKSLRSEQAVDRELEKQQTFGQFSRRLDAFASDVVVQRAKEQKDQKSPPDVMDEALILLGKNFNRLTAEELRSRGVKEFSAHADRRVQTRLDRVMARKRKNAPAPGGDDAIQPPAADKEFGSNKTEEEAEEISPAQDPRSRGGATTARGRRAGRGGRGGRGAGSVRGAPAGGGGGAATRPGAPVEGRGRTPDLGGGGGDAPGNRGAARKPTGGAGPGGVAGAKPRQQPGLATGGLATAERKDAEANGARASRFKGGTAARADDRVFFALLGAEASSRTRALLKPVPGVSELPVRRAFVSDGRPSSKPTADQQQGGGQNAKPNPAPTGGGAAPSAEKQLAAPGYTIFQVTLPAAEADELVGRLESQPGLALRSLGKSLLSGLPTAPGTERSRATRSAGEKKAAGRGATRTLVLVVLER